MSPYEIGASLANSAASGANPYGVYATSFVFGNADNPNLSGGDQTPTQSATATATTALPGGTAVSNVGAPAYVPNASSVSSGFNLTTLVLVAGAALLVAHFLHHSK